MSAEPSKLKTSAQWLVSLLPAGGAAYAYFESHPVAVEIGCTVWIAFTGFTAKVWKELEDEAVKGTANLFRSAPGKAAQIVARFRDWLWLTLTAWAPGYTNRYRKELIYRYGQFNDRGLGLINANRLNLEKVYVDLTIDADPALSRSLNDLLKRDFREARPIWDFLNQVKPGATLAVTGPPGSGKTTLIQHLLLVHARNRQRRFRARGRVPFFVEIRRLPVMVGTEALAAWGATEAVANRPNGLPSLAQVLTKLLPEQYRDFPAPSPGWTERQLAKGQALLLFDGLDEVADEAVRRGLARWLEEELTGPAVRRCPAIVTSRPQGYRTAPLSRALVLAVQPFTRAQVERFVDRWYLANEIVSSGQQDTPEVRRRAREEGRDLLERLQKTPRINRVVSDVNPNQFKELQDL
jgi:energy-coupling factor transporter ATP-binding protein EcfA2